MSVLILLLLVLGGVLAAVRAFNIPTGRVNLGWLAVAIAFLVAILVETGV
jgi:hypothetical protein